MCGVTLRLDAALNLDNEACKFVCIVIRFEYALKKCGYLTQGRNNEVNPDWQRFANELEGSFFDRIKNDNSVSEILNPAPHQQIISNGSMDWRGKNVAASNQELLDAVKRVRNNLLHGGKSDAPDERRNSILVKEALYILTEAIKLNDSVRNEFEGIY